jgi:hypothetical protein
VNNPKDFPEHLIDGKPDTAWNGRPGDLVGGWLAFRVPRDARVTSIALSAGFDKTSAAGDDLFVANYRVRAVRLERDGRAIGEAELDPEVRAPQRVALDAPGGDFRVVVTAVVPGTKKAWRELAISEFAVFGRPGAVALDAPRPPAVRVGGLDVAAAPVVAPAGDDERRKTRGPFASLEAFCRAYDAAAAPEFAARENEYPGRVEGPYCEPRGPLPVEGGPGGAFLEVGTVRVTSRTRAERVAVRTGAGVFVTDVAVDDDDYANPGCGGACSWQAKGARFVATPAGPALVVGAYRHCWLNPFPSDDPAQRMSGSSTYSELAGVCRADPAGAVRCTTYEVASVTTAYRAHEEAFADVPWGRRAALRVTADGDVFFEGGAPKPDE